MFRITAIILPDNLPGLRGFNPGLTPIPVPDPATKVVIVIDFLLEAVPPLEDPPASLVALVAFFARVTIPVTAAVAAFAPVDVEADKAEPNLPPGPPNLPRFKILDGVATGIMGCCWFG
jgi:hypothetical protein